MPEPETPKPFVNPMSGLQPAQDFHDPVAEARMKPTKEVLAFLGLSGEPDAAESDTAGNATLPTEDSRPGKATKAKS